METRNEPTQVQAFRRGEIGKPTESISIIRKSFNRKIYHRSRRMVAPDRLPISFIISLLFSAKRVHLATRLVLQRRSVRKPPTDSRRAVGHSLEAPVILHSRLASLSKGKEKRKQSMENPKQGLEKKKRITALSTDTGRCEVPKVTFVRALYSKQLRGGCVHGGSRRALPRPLHGH